MHRAPPRSAKSSTPLGEPLRAAGASRYDCPYTDQLWELGNGTVRNRLSGLCLGVAGLIPTFGAKLQIRTCVSAGGGSQES